MVWFWKYGRRRRAAWTKDRASFSTIWYLVWVLECPAYKVNRVLGAFCFLDKGSADGVIGGRDVYQQGLAGVSCKG